MTRSLQRYKWWILLCVLVALNVFRYWPAKHQDHGFAGGPPPGPGGFPQPDAAMQARLDAMPAEQRTAFEERMKDDREFFASVQNLPEAERQQKLQEHFAQNPPPGMPPGGPDGSPPPGPPPDGGGPGGPGDGSAPRIPPPDVRRGMDQGIVSAMKEAGMQ